MVTLTRKENFNESSLDSGALALGHKEIKLLFNAGPFPGGGDCLIVEIGGRVETVNSNDLIGDLPAYICSTT